MPGVWPRFDSPRAERADSCYPAAGLERAARRLNITFDSSRCAELHNGVDLRYPASVARHLPTPSAEQRDFLHEHLAVLLVSHSSMTDWRHNVTLPLFARHVRFARAQYLCHDQHDERTPPQSGLAHCKARPSSAVRR